MIKPQRIQRKRIAGWVQPDNTVYVGRPGRFGNPFSAAELGHALAVEKYVDWLDGRLDDQFPEQVVRRKEVLRGIERLRGKNLSCWCPLDKPCHADILLERANANSLTKA